MRPEEVSFNSDGVRLSGAFFEPPTGAVLDGPTVVVCSGFTGLRNIHPERFARALTPSGHSVFGFDYRGFAPSEGARGEVLLSEQVRDIANAVRFVQSSRPKRGVALVGWGMAGGLVLAAARLLRGLSGIACFNGFYDAIRVQRAVRGDVGFEDFLQRLEALQRAALEEEETTWIDPFFAYPLDPISQRYVDDVLRRDPQYAPDVWLPFADSLLSFAPEGALSHLGETPALIAHGAENRLHPAEEARSLHERYPGPKELFWLESAGHTEWMLDDHPTFKQLASKLDQWVRAL